MPIGLERDIVDRAVYDRTVERFHKDGIRLPKISQLADPLSLATSSIEGLKDADPDTPDARNLFRVHWHNADDRQRLAQVPAHVVVPPELTGIEAKIIVAGEGALSPR